MPVPLSVLDLAPVASGSTSRDALLGSVALARLAERLGYARVWFAEHHGMPNIASSAPEILIAHVATATERIRLGTGGVMLPNHAPLQVAEDFHTLEALHPGRIDLGIGRAPGTDPATSRALRPFDAEHFPQQLAELVGLSRGELDEAHPFRAVRVVPGGVALPPIWLLGSSGATARLAGELGMGYAFASHFTPAPAAPVLRAYREAFRPSEQFPRPHAIVAVSAVVADSGDEAERLALSMQLAWVRLHRGEMGPIATPEEAAAFPYTPRDRAVAESWRALQLIGTPPAVRERIEALAAEAGADEVMVSTIVHDQAARLRSYELLAGEMGLEVSAKAVAAGG